MTAPRCIQSGHGRATFYPQHPAALFWGDFLWGFQFQGGPGVNKAQLLSGNEAVVQIPV